MESSYDSVVAHRKVRMLTTIFWAIWEGILLSPNGHLADEATHSEFDPKKPCKKWYSSHEPTGFETKLNKHTVNIVAIYQVFSTTVYHAKQWQSPFDGDI